MTTVSVPSGENRFDAYVARPVASDRPAVVVLHEVFGVNADMRAHCDELAAAGFLALCPELFWRQQRGVDFSSWSEEEWRQGLALYCAYDPGQGVRDVEATVALARSMPGCSGKVAVMGFCLGGLLTFLSAARIHVDAAVAFHGGRTEEFLDEAPDIDAPLQMHLAVEDEFIPPSAQRAIHAALDGRPGMEIHDYPGCRHAFARHGGHHYNAAAAQLAKGRMLDFLTRQLT